MAKYQLIFSLVLTLILMQESILAQENVGVGTITPGYRLDVQSNPSSTSLININSKVNYAGMLDIRAFEGYSVTADGYGLGGKFTGGYRGIESLGAGGTYTGTAYGVFGHSTGTAGTRVGLYGTASGGTTANYGVWGSVNGGANFYGVYGQNTNLAGYAGYFNGRGFFTQELRADKNLIVDDTTWTSRIWNQSGGILVKSISDLELTIDRNNSGIIGFFELFNGAGEQLFWVSEAGHGRIMGSYTVDGNLGVGTNAPSTKMQILGGSDVSLTTNGFAQFGATSTWNLIFDDNEIMARNNGAGNDLLIQQDAGNILMCGLEQGRVGIGVQLATNLATGYALSVDGKIVAEELRIQNSTNWPDYVFAEDYDLMSLEELKASIEMHHHLPNIPAAAIVESEGMLVGDMQKKMMEKIEELTLYIIELHEFNKQQQAEIEQLKRSLEAVSVTSAIEH